MALAQDLSSDLARSRHQRDVKVEKKTVPESAKLSSDKIMDMWNKARIPTTYHTHVVEKVKSVVDDYKLIKRTKTDKVKHNEHEKKNLKKGAQAISEVEDSLLSSASQKPQTVQDMLSLPNVASALGRINLSDKKFPVLTAAIAQACGQGIKYTFLSRSTVQRKRQQHRSTIDSSICQQFQDRDRNPFLIHWDGKIMNYVTNTVDPHFRTDRLAVVVTGCYVEKISSSTGQAQTNATF
ncbi:hypothetical protein HELRODRAFT_175955 [Helobdella robusta]|uniref:Uncharacterized protein n=1 Tax=Helobdella robusta TaxID=6412 RepID=T1F9Y7_HELRO|nr:hypothetical protein HELRODRAFT_175955 [Helobdella robusta]ESO00513.1 hypothetical protein HELRODRAFT_175955 [Helobdella robusta]